MKKILLLLFPFCLFGQIPTYYSSIDFSAQPEVIEAELSNLITTTHTTVLTYTPGIWNALKITDLNPEDVTQSKLLLMYGYNDDDSDYKTDRTRDKTLICNFSGCGDDGYWNREHIFPKSLGTPNLGTENAGSDAHAIRACDAGMNSRRSNRKFALGSGNAQITSQGNWYPGDEWKGDVARMIMYMYLRYPTQAIASNVAVSTYDNNDEMPDIFLQWNVEDPVSEYEIQRNDYLQTIQGNRNPFIDNPYLATKIWGGDAATDTWQVLLVEEMQTQEAGFSLYPNPAAGSVYFKYNHQPTATFIINPAGQVVITDKNLTDNQVELPSTPGVYFIVFKFNQQNITKKVIVK